MNDRYLYRAKHIHALSENEHLNGLWIVGYLSGEHHISNKDGEYLIDPSTICQCTGLKDKNGKLIWENDILMCYGNKKDFCKVCFGGFKVIDIENMVAVDVVQGWYYKPLETDGLSKCEPFCYEMPLTNYYIERMEAEVIGNIFDNPELLEVGE